MKERLEHHEGSSGKFWEVATEGSRMTVTFGKLGTAGQAKPKDFDSADAAESAATTLIAEKLKKGYRRAGASAPAVASAAAGEAAATGLPADLAALVGVPCFVSGEEREDDVVVFEWASFAAEAQQGFLGDLFGDCAEGDFAELLDLSDGVAWTSTSCVPFALYGVVSGGDSFQGGGGMPQFHRLLVLDSSGAVHGIEVDGSAVPAKQAALVAKSWKGLKLKKRAPAATAGALPVIKPTRRIRLLSSLGEFCAPSRQTPFVHSVKSSANGARAVLTTRQSSEDPARVYDIESGALLRAIAPSACGAVLGPDGTRVVTASADRQSGQRRIACSDADTGMEHWSCAVFRKCSYAYVALAVSPDGKTLVTSCDSSDGKSLLAFRMADGTLVWAASLGKGDVRAEALAFSPDGKLVAAGCSDESLQIWDAAAGTRLHHVPYDNAPRGIAWLADGTRLVASSSHLTAIWELGAKKPSVVLAEYERGRCAGDVIVSSAGFIAARVDWTQIDLWDLEGALLERLDLKKKVGVASLAACPGGLLVGTQADCALRFAFTR